MEMRQGIHDWFIASELVIVLVSLALSAILLTNQDQWSARSIYHPPVSSAAPRPMIHPDLHVVGMGSQAPTGSGQALQGASALQQSGQSGENLQQNAGGDKQLQPNTGESALSTQQAQ